MKKQLLSVILTLSLVMGLTSAGAFAVSEQNDIRNVEQLKLALSEDLTKAEQAQIIERTDETIVDELLMEKLDEAAALLNSEGNYADMKILPDGSGYDIKTYDLGDGCVLTVELRDEAEGPSEYAAVASPMAATTQPDQWKEYGNRYFTAKASVNISNAKATMRLEHHYTLSAAGIEAKSGEAFMSWSKPNSSYSHTKPVVSDQYAKTAGASDVNIECTYTFIAGNLKAVYKLDTAVGFVAIDKAAKKIKVRHSWNLTKI